MNFAIFGGLEIPKTKGLLFRKIIGLALFNVEWISFVSNVLKESIHKTDVLVSFCSDHSPILFAMNMIKEVQRGKHLWKFNSSLSSNKKFVRNMKNHTATTTMFLNAEHIFHQIRWDFLKYEIRKFFINFSASEAKKRNEETNTLENKMKTFEENLSKNESKNLKS